MRSTGLCVALLAALVVTSHAHAVAMLRITCDTDAVGAEVLINGKFKGDCPLDIKVQEGTLNLRVQLKVDALRERVFEQQIRMGDGTVKSVEAQLGPVAFNVEGKRREAERLAAQQRVQDERIAAERQAQADEQHREKVALAEQRIAADAGDSAAMIILGYRYAYGQGVPKSDEQANDWYRKAKAAGNVLAELKLASWGATPPSAKDFSDVVRMLGLPSEPERRVEIEGADDILSFIASDPFFFVSGGGQPITYSRDIQLSGAENSHADITCDTSRKLSKVTSKVKSKNFSGTTNTVSSLGGLLTISAASSFDNNGIPRQKMTSINKISGQPFPLTAGKRFGFSVTLTYNDQPPYSEERVCTVSGSPIKLASQHRIEGLVTPLMCWWQGLGYQGITRPYWHEPSGCFINPFSTN